jgi:hypothetical protein
MYRRASTVIVAARNAAFYSNGDQRDLYTVMFPRYDEIYSSMYLQASFLVNQGTVVYDHSQLSLMKEDTLFRECQEEKASSRIDQDIDNQDTSSTDQCHRTCLTRFLRRMAAILWMLLKIHITGLCIGGLPLVWAWMRTDIGGQRSGGDNQLAILCVEAALLHQLPHIFFVLLYPHIYYPRLFAIRSVAMSLVDVALRIIFYAYGYEGFVSRIIIYLYFLLHMILETHWHIRRAIPAPVKTRIKEFALIFVPMFAAMLFVVALYLFLPDYLPYRSLFTTLTPIAFGIVNWLGRSFAIKLSWNHCGRSFLIAAFPLMVTQLFSQCIAFDSNLFKKDAAAWCTGVVIQSCLSAAGRITIYLRDGLLLSIANCKRVDVAYFQYPPRRRLISDLMIQELVTTALWYPVVAFYVATGLGGDGTGSGTGSTTESANIESVVSMTAIFMSIEAAFWFLTIVWNLYIQNLALLQLTRQWTRFRSHLIAQSWLAFMFFLYVGDRLGFLFR